MSVTAIIPTYNRATYLRDCLSSVFGQTLPPAQVIVVDDGSKDSTRALVAEFGLRVQYLWKPNGGKSTALNLGLKHATGDLIWIFDDDDIAEPDFLQRAVRALQENPGYGFAYGDYDRFKCGETGAIQYLPGNVPNTKFDNLFLTVLTEPCFIFQSGLLVRASCYRELGAFDEAFIRSQDFEMLLRLVRRYSGVRVAGITFHQREHSGLRGSADSPVPADRVLETWLRNDRLLFSRIYQTCALSEFVCLTQADTDLSNEQKFTALLQRSGIMARRGVWDKAALDLRRAGEIAEVSQKRTLTDEQEAILRRVFDLASFAPHSFAEAGEFRRILKQIKPAALQQQIRAALLWSLAFTIGAARLNGHKENFYRFLRIYFDLATPNALLRTLFDVSFISAGLSLVKSRRNQKIAFEQT